MYEKRLTVRLMTYWTKLKGEAFAPPYHKFNSAVVDDIWQNCMVLEVQPSAAKEKLYKYIHFGDTLHDAVGKNLLGQVLGTNMKFFPGAKIIHRIDEIFGQEIIAPIEDEGEFVNDKGKIVKFRACLLAFCKVPGQISHVLVGVSWRSF